MVDSGNAGYRITPVFNRSPRIWGIILIAFLWTGMAFGADKYDYIDINNPLLKKVPIAIPLFKPVTGNASEQETAQTGANMLAETLSFTGYFKILDRGSFLVDAQKADVAAPVFKGWTSVGAELLVTGGISLNNSQIEMELRLFDTYNERQLIGRKYSGNVKDLRVMIRRFCNEIMGLLTGSTGLFESKIVYISSGSAGKEVYSCDFDGSSPTQITHNHGINLSPAMSTDGKWVAYTSYAKGKPDLYIQNISDNRISVVDKKGMGISPAWVPGKFELAASLSFSGDPEIYLLTGTGKVINRLTDSPGIDVSPTFSPDGGRMAFVSRRGGTPQIYVQNMNSGHAERVTFQGNNNTQPEWSPKGDKIVYTALAKGNGFNICVVGVNGNGLMQLTSGQGDNESPSWSPDGSMIAFSSTREGTSRIYVMTAFGADQRRLMSAPGQQSEPKWSPGVTN
ncbi:MAG: Tol-Pal system beta propeller repeat protein TolB [Deltaproteobacteria bacterium]|nr:Tol-Pal system beta propeller repeat protein TolB [Deltaproteobacteria bacterium]